MKTNVAEGYQTQLKERPSRRILLVNGAAPDRQLVHEHLGGDSQYRYEFIEVTSGAEAFDMLDQTPVDCLIIEQDMDDMTSLEFLAKLGERGESLRPPVVMLASGGELELAVEALHSGAQDFLVKEKATPQTVQRAINNAIEKVALRRELLAQQIELREELAERRRIQELLGTQKRVLESVALGKSLSEILQLITTEVEARIPGSLSSILLVSKDGKTLHSASVNRLPAAYNQIVEGVQISPRAGSCGSAAHLKRRVVAEDIATDYYWQDYKEIALSFNLHSCWSTPILSPEGEMSGALAVYFDHSRSPIAAELETLDLAAYLAGISIERQCNDELLRDSREHLRLALRGGGLGVWEWNVSDRSAIVDEKVLEFLGLSGDTSPVPRERLVERIHPDDLETMRAAIYLAFGNKSLFEATCRIMNPDGSVHGYMRAMGDIHKDENGKVERLIGVAEDVTVEAQATEAIQRSEQHVRDVADNVLIMIAVLTPEGIVHWVNQTAARASRVSLESFRGLHFADGPPWRSDENARERIREAIRRANRGETVRYDTTTYIEGHAVEIDFMLAPLRDSEGHVTHLVASGLDITERKRAERALRENEELANRILQSSPDCVVILDLEGSVLDINPPGRTMLEIDNLESIRSLSWPLIWPEENREEVYAALDKAANGEMSRFQGFCPTFRETPKWWDVMVAPIAGTDGRISRVIATSRDISDAKILEAQRENILEAEHAARLELEKINRAKDEFLATLSHELRTPLTSIIGWMEILRGESVLDPAIRSRGYDVIERNARAQHQLIEDILDVSRIIAGQLKVKQVEVELRPLVSAAIESLRPLAKDKNLELLVDLDTIPPITGDPMRLQQVVWNLLSNAIKFTPQGGTVQVILRETNGHVLIEVRDNGAGIPPQFMPNVFDRFRQADSSSTRRHSGLGLGLAIVKHLVELHGGTVTASSAGIEQGATFKVELPLPPTPEVPTELPHAPADENEGELKGVKVLIVDDEPDVLDLLRMLLEKQGAQAHTASNASDALNSLESFIPDVLISDIGMPVTDGYMFIKKLRDRYPQGLPFPALALTAYSSEQDRLQTIAAGFTAHLSKPLKGRQMIDVVKELTAS